MFYHLKRNSTQSRAELVTDSSERRDLINLDERETNKRTDKQTGDIPLPGVRGIGGGEGGLSRKIQNRKLSDGRFTRYRK